MNVSNCKGVAAGLAAGGVMTVGVAILMGQGASQPVRSATEYFVTGEGDDAHLWVREGAALRCVGHGACKAHGHDHGHDHKEGDGHAHDAPAKK